MEKGSEIIDVTAGINIPGPFGCQHFGTHHLKDQNAQKIMKAREDQKLGDLCKIAITQYSLDHWVA